MKIDNSKEVFSTPLEVKKIYRTYDGAEFYTYKEASEHARHVAMLDVIKKELQEFHESLGPLRPKDILEIAKKLRPYLYLEEEDSCKNTKNSTDDSLGQPYSPPFKLPIVPTTITYNDYLENEHREMQKAKLEAKEACDD